MVRCDRCDGYVSRDYARVFGNNDDRVLSCPHCPAEWARSEERPEEKERKLTFRMSEFEDSAEATEPTGSEVGSSGDHEAPEARGAGGRFGRVGRAVSGLF